MDRASATFWPPVTYLLWDRLVDTDVNTRRPIPSLASSWESNEDATRWTFNLRQGVTFSDGMPLTAADVIYTAQRHLDPNIGSLFRVELAIVDPDRFEIPDDNTVVFNLNSTSVDFPGLTASRDFRIVPDGSGDSIQENPVGTGPFTVESADRDGISVFAARDDYWQGSLLLGKVTVVSIADADARVAAALAGQIDIAGQITDITPTQASLFERDPDFYIQESPQGGMSVLNMITTEPPFDNPLVRKALRLVVDPEEIIAVVGQGRGVPACNNPTWPTDQYYLPMECPQDIERAKELLAEAGYPDGLTIELETSNSYVESIPIATVYKEQAAEAGITVNINQVPSDGYWTNTWMVEPWSS